MTATSADALDAFELAALPRASGTGEVASGWRRDRALEVAAALADEGGWDGVAMRTVAELSGSALATLYKEFPSKANLILATAEVWLRDLEDASPSRLPPSGAADSVAGFLEDLTEAALARPHLTMAVLRAVLTCDRAVGRDAARLRERIVSLMMLRLDEPKVDDAARLEVVVDVWFSQMLAAAQGCQQLEETRRLVGRAAYCVMRD